MHDEIRPLTSLRMIAALMVFLHHQRPYPRVGQSVLDAVMIEGHFGVTIFFVLSGFLITLRYLPLLQAGKFSWSDYLIKRVARIWPLYLVVVVIVARLSSVALHEVHPITWTLTQGFFDARKFDGIQVAWSLTVEESFYLLAPVVFLTLVWTKRRGLRSAVVLIGWTVGMVAAGGLLMQIAQITGLAAPEGFLATLPLIQGYTLFGRMGEFALGLAAALVVLCWREQLWSARWQRWAAETAGVGAMLAIAGVMLIVNSTGQGIHTQGWGNLVVAGLSAVWIVALTCPTTLAARVLSLDPLVYLGRVSYAFYLIHFTALWYFFRDMIHPPAGWSLVVLYLGANVVSAVLYEFVERPGRALVLMIWRVWRRRPQAVPRTTISGAGD